MSLTLILFLSISAESSPISSLVPMNLFDEDINSISYGSDGGMYNRWFLEGDLYFRQSRTSDASSPPTLWTNGSIVYKVHESVGCPSSGECIVLMDAVEHYHNKTCIRFKEWTDEEDFVLIFKNTDTGACWSEVGQAGGQQLLSLGQKCWHRGIVIHELGHSLGLWHEMNRPDRDDFVTINWENIMNGYADAFEKQAVSTLNEALDEFDLNSIMMYDEYAFSKDKDSPTITTIDKSVIGPIWQKKGLSSTDRKRLYRLYNC